MYSKHCICYRTRTLARLRRVHPPPPPPPPPCFFSFSFSSLVLFFCLLFVISVLFCFVGVAPSSMQLNVFEPLVALLLIYRSLPFSGLILFFGLQWYASKPEVRIQHFLFDLSIYKYHPRIPRPRPLHTHPFWHPFSSTPCLVPCTSDVVDLFPSDIIGGDGGRCREIGPSNRPGSQRWLAGLVGRPVCLRRVVVDMLHKLPHPPCLVGIR